MDGNFCWGGIFFYRVIGIWRGVILTIRTFFKAKNNIKNITIIFILRALLSLEARGFWFAANYTEGWQKKIVGSQMTTMTEKMNIIIIIIKRLYKRASLRYV